MTVTLTSEVLAQLREEAGAAHPHECCGMLLGEGEAIAALAPAANVHPAPATRFEIDPQALVDAHRAARGGGLQVLGYYHSHPGGPARPSATDSLMAGHGADGGDGSIWAIIGTTGDAGRGAGGDVTFWRNGERGFAALSYRVRDG